MKRYKIHLIGKNLEPLIANENQIKAILAAKEQGGMFEHEGSFINGSKVDMIELIYEKPAYVALPFEAPSLVRNVNPEVLKRVNKELKDKFNWN